MIAELPHNEAERLAALLEYNIMDTQPEAAFDDLTELAASILDMPIALVTLLDSERQWFKSKVGLATTETPRDVAFCSHAILHPESILEVEDARLDPRFAHNPLVTAKPHIRFYAGAPLVTSDGRALGTLCVIDHKPRKLTEDQRHLLRTLSRQVMTQLELHKKSIELKELGKQLQKSNRELENFTRVASHDLKEPLRKIISFSQLLQMDLGDDLLPQAAESLEMIMDGSRRMNNLVSDLLELAKLGAGPLKLTRFPLKVCVQGALEALALRIEESGATLLLNELPEIEGDKRLLTQLFQNLIGNALKFTDGAVPRIEITAGQKEGQFVFGVKDQGIGIDPSFQDQIFEPFKRLHNRDQYDGTGIGLAIVYKAVEQHGGRLWVDSKLGHGSHFQFTLG